MNDDFEVGVDDGRIIIRDPGHGLLRDLFQTYDRPQLLLKRRMPINDHALLGGAFHAAVDKARELGWIVQSKWDG